MKEDKKNERKWTGNEKHWILALPYRLSGQLPKKRQRTDIEESQGKLKGTWKEFEKKRMENYKKETSENERKWKDLEFKRCPTGCFDL